MANTSKRLFIDRTLDAGLEYACDGRQANYVLNVLRLAEGDRIAVFDGRNGEWRAELASSGQGRCLLRVLDRFRAQDSGSDTHYLFTNLKRARLDNMVQMATELGVSYLRPVITMRTQAARVDLERMRANAVEAAEQCGILRIPEVAEPHKLAAVLEAWDGARALIYCDERMEVSDPLKTLGRLKPGPMALLTGPEGGFDPSERDLLLSQSFVAPISLGPRVMRADTAGLAALALLNATLGDWR